MTVRYFEDYVVGLVVECGRISIDEEEIVAFARRYDPQPFHVDAAAAAVGPYGGLIASGWQTAALMTRLFATQYLSSVSSLGSPGVDELRWTAPLRPGDTVSVRATVLEARASRSKPDRGFIRTHVEVANQDGLAILDMKVMNLVLLRGPAASMPA